MNSLGLGCWTSLKEMDGLGRNGVTGLRMMLDEEEEEGATLMVSSVRR
jgi:hypothetical protein